MPKTDPAPIILGPQGGDCGPFEPVRITRAAPVTRQIRDKLARPTQPLPATALDGGFIVKPYPTDNAKQPGCAAFAVASALRAYLAVYQKRDPGWLNPYFLWEVARRRDQFLDLRTSLGEVLAVANDFGTTVGSSECPVFDNPGFEGMEKAPEFLPQDRTRITQVVNLGAGLGDWLHWLKRGPVIVQLNITPRTFNHLRPDADGHARVKYDPHLEDDRLRFLQDPAQSISSALYASHAVVLTGFDPDPRHGFKIVNTADASWGNDGCGFVDLPTAISCFAAGYGLAVQAASG